MNTRPLTEIKREAPEVVLAKLRSEEQEVSRQAGHKLVAEAKSFGVNVRDYLTLRVDPRIAAEAKRFNGLNGYEASLAFLNLPVRNDFENGITLQAASETFQTFSGTRALFPPVIDDLLKWSYRQDHIETVAPILANSRTINGTELISTVVNDTEADAQVSSIVAEMGRVPMKSIRTSETSVKIWKHGSGLRTSYEFLRRASLDLFTPYAARIQRELERSKMKAAVALLLNGDGVIAANAAAGVDNQSVYDASTNTTSTNGVINWQNFLYWIVQRAKAGVPVDTVVGNWDAYFQWLKLFAVKDSSAGVTAAEHLSAAGVQIGGVPLITAAPRFAISSDMTANYLLGMSRADTLEELIEAGSQINESERSIENQTVTYVKTENTGYRLVYGDTRRVYNYGA
jgi:hypothetical protein